MSFEQLEKDNKQVCKELFRLLNYMGNEQPLTEILAETLINEHRTLQASFIRMIQQILDTYAQLDESRCTDLRNEAALKYAKKVAESTLDMFIPYV
jgi:septal ring factor EnvC (AmiA/AmiB activator)